MTSDSRKALACLGRFLSPLFAPLGFDDWRSGFGCPHRTFCKGPSPALPSGANYGRRLRSGLLCDVFTGTPHAAFSYSVCSTHHALPLSLPSARPAANGGMQFILHYFRRQLRGGWEVIEQEGSCLECYKISCNAGDSHCRVLLTDTTDFAIKARNVILPSIGTARGPENYPNRFDHIFIRDNQFSFDSLIIP